MLRGNQRLKRSSILDGIEMPAIFVCGPIGINGGVIACQHPVDGPANGSNHREQEKQRQNNRQRSHASSEKPWNWPIRDDAVTGWVLYVNWAGLQSNG